LNFSTSIRVLAVALAFTTLSFAAGIVGDLATPPPANSGTSVVLRLPPPETARALTPIVRTEAAEARRYRVTRLSARYERPILAAEKPAHVAASEPKPEPKIDPDRAPKEGDAEPVKGETRQDEPKRA
jgi:hypothetical protein